MAKRFGWMGLYGCSLSRGLVFGIGPASWSRGTCGPAKRLRDGGLRFPAVRFIPANVSPVHRPPSLSLRNLCGSHLSIAPVEALQQGLVTDLLERVYTRDKTQHTQKDKKGAVHGGSCQDCREAWMPNAKPYMDVLAGAS